MGGGKTAPGQLPGPVSWSNFGLVQPTFQTRTARKSTRKRAPEANFGLGQKSGGRPLAAGRPAAAQDPAAGRLIFPPPLERTSKAPHRVC